MLSNQVEGKIIKQAHEWDDHTIVTWDYEGADVIYFLGQEEGQYDVDIFLLPLQPLALVASPRLGLRQLH
jgi:hypothetical protein